MGNVFQRVVDIEDSVDVATPILEFFEYHIESGVGEESEYGFCIENHSTGALYVIPESRYGLIRFNQDYYVGNKIRLCFFLNDNIQVGDYDEEVILTYNGGEFVIPTKISIYGKTSLEERSIFSNIEEEEINNASSFKLNQLSFHPQDTGYIEIDNPIEKFIEYRILTDSDKVQIEECVQAKGNVRVPFKIDIGRKDIMLGKVPLRSKPAVPASFRIEYVIDDEKFIEELSINFTTLPKMTTDKKISDSISLIELQTDFAAIYGDYLLNNGTIDSSILLDYLKAEINYDYTNIVNRLRYVYFCIINKDFEGAKTEIKVLQKYSLYFDMNGQGIDEILLCFIEWMNGREMIGALATWEYSYKTIWWKIILKNRLLKSNPKSITDFAKLYEKGHDNYLSRVDMINQLNKCPMSPRDLTDVEKAYYKTILEWATKNDFLGLKLIKYIENHYLLFINNKILSQEICQKIYDLHRSKQSLQLLCAYNIEENIYDVNSKALFEKALDEHLNLKDMMIHYVNACYRAKMKINLKYIRSIINCGKLKTDAYNYLLYNVMIEEEKYRNLKMIFRKDLEAFDVTVKEFSIYYYPQSRIEIDRFLAYVIENEKSELIIYCLSENISMEISDDQHLQMIEVLLKNKNMDAYHYVVKAYNDNKYNQRTLETIKENFVGTLNELMKLQKVLVNYFPKEERIVELIIYKAILTNQIDDEILEVFLNSINGFNLGSKRELIYKRVCRSILMEEYLVKSEVVELLEEYIELEENTTIELALLKMYSKTTVNERLAKPLVLKYISNDTIFPWFSYLLNVLDIDYQLRHEQFFEHIGNKEDQVYFVYRIDGENDFEVVKMKQVIQGVFLARVVLFYQEQLQYYIKAQKANNNMEVELSDIYVHSEIDEIQKNEDKYDLINTIILAKEMDDESSVESEIKRYFELDNVKTDDVQIL